jgi:alanine racemase
VVNLHLKVDTGMHRVGAAPDRVIELARLVHEAPGVRLEAVWTHLACADEPRRPVTSEQLDRLEVVEGELAAAGVEVPMVHAANSAGALLHPRARRDLVRCGLAVYGLSPDPSSTTDLDLRPAMSVVSEVAWVHRAPAGAGIGYGHHARVERDTNVATVPIGYADGVARRLGLEGGVALVGGVRRSILGVVTMDQLMVDCGDDDVHRGDEVVLLGRQGDEWIGADEWAGRLGTISYEVLCGFGPRLPRRHRRSGQGPGAAGTAVAEVGRTRSTATNPS